MRFRPRHLILATFPLLFAMTPIVASAQYIFTDMNGDGVHTAADVLSPTGTTNVDVWLITNQNPDGSTAYCRNGCDELTINSYEFILRASGGSVTWLGYASNPDSFPVAITDQNATDFYAQHPGEVIHSAGAKRLGTLQVSVNSGSPTLDFVTSTPLSPVYLTEFGSQCYGLDMDNTYKLGTDWGNGTVPWTIDGTVFNDANASGCVPDAGESGLAGWGVTAEPGPHWTTTDANGVYHLCGLDPGTYTVKVLQTGGWGQTCPTGNSPQFVTVATGQNIPNVNFGMTTVIASVSGRVFEDDNGTSSGNCVPDAGENGLSGWTVTMNPGNRTTTTNLQGDYSFSFVANGTYTLVATPPPGLPTTWTRTCPPSAPQSVTVSQQIAYTGANIGERPDPIPPDLKITNASGVARPGYAQTYGIMCANIGGLPATGVLVTVPLPSEVAHQTSGPNASYNPGTHTVTFTVGTLNPGSQVPLVVKVSIPASVPLGTSLTETATGTLNETDPNLANNSATSTKIVVGGFDPNAISVQPSGRILRSQVLSYRIDFQNVGTAAALNIVVRDTLDSNLDPATVVSGGSLHPYYLTQSGQQLIWTFQDINLPDSTSNEADSHGCVEFTVMPRSSAADGTSIPNHAAIYFDFNSPVITNAVANVVDSKPVLSPVPDHAIVEGSTLDQPLTATDPEADALTFQLVSGPSYATVTTTNATHGNLHLAPQSGSSGTANVIVAASDGLLSAQDTCLVNVLTITGVAMVETFDPQRIRLNSSLPTTCLTFRPASGDFRATDVDPSSVVLSAGSARIGPHEGTRAPDAPAGTVCFATSDLRALFSNLSTSRTVSALCEGTLISGAPFLGRLDLTVTVGTGRLAASVTPNPINPSGLLTFRTTQAGPVRVTLFDLNGRRVRTLLDRASAAPGYQELVLDGFDDRGHPLASGIYFYRIRAAEGSQTSRVMILR